MLVIYTLTLVDYRQKKYELNTNILLYFIQYRSPRSKPSDFVSFNAIRILLPTIRHRIRGINKAS